MDKNKRSISTKTTIKILFTTLIGVWMTNFLYSFILPQVLLMEKIERNNFYKRTFLLTITIGTLAVLAVYLFYKRIENAIKIVENGKKLENEDFNKIDKSFSNIEIFLFLVGALSYILAIIINIIIEITLKESIDFKYWLFRTTLAISFGILNGLVIARLINYAWIDAKNLLHIHFIENRKNLSKTNKKLIIPSILLLFVNLSFLVVGTLNFYERYAFTILKFSFIFTHFFTLAIKFLLVDLIIFFAILSEHQKHIDHVYNQFDIMANQEIDLSKRVNIVSFDEIGMMISNINIVLNKLQNSFLKVDEAEKKVASLSLKTTEVFQDLKLQSTKISEIIKFVQAIGDNESKVIEKANGDFKNLIIAIENTISIYKFQSEFIEKTSISMKNILNSFQTISRLTIESANLFESLASNIYKGEDQVGKLSSINKKMIDSNSKIQETTKLILDISERSNLLAMNAAIEAAHAQEAGAGFSVVAEEMRKLSEITSNSAQQIEQIIKTIIESNKEAGEVNISIENLFSEIHNQLKETDTKIKNVSKSNEEQTLLIDKNISEVEQLIKVNQEIKENTEKIIEIQPTVISSLNDLQNKTKSLLENNRIMIETVEKLNKSSEFASSSFEMTFQAISQLKEILSNYKIIDFKELVENKNEK